MKRLLLIMLLSLFVLQANEEFPKWEDAKQFKYNKFIPPKNYKTDGIKEPIKTIEGETVKYFTSGTPPEFLDKLLKKNLESATDEHQRMLIKLHFKTVKKENKYTKKIRYRVFAENNKAYRSINYDEDTGKKWMESVFFIEKTQIQKITIK